MNETPTPETKPAKPTAMHAGFDGDKQITPWERSRDRAYFPTRRRMLQEKRPMQIRTQTFLEKR